MILKPGLASLLLAISLATSFLNMTSGIRDGVMTTSIPSFGPTEIIEGRLWTESPMQTLHNFMGKDASIYFVGTSGNAGLPFEERIRAKLGRERVDSSEPPLDLRDVVSVEDLNSLESFVHRWSYRSVQPCPHDPMVECVIAVGWNRDRTRESGVDWLGMRITDTTYLIADDSILRVE